METIPFTTLAFRTLCPHTVDAEPTAVPACETINDVDNFIFLYPRRGRPSELHECFVNTWSTRQIARTLLYRTCAKKEAIVVSGRVLVSCIKRLHDQITEHCSLCRSQLFETQNNPTSIWQVAERFMIEEVDERAFVSRCYPCAGLSKLVPPVQKVRNNESKLRISA